MHYAVNDKVTGVYIRLRRVLQANIAQEPAPRSAYVREDADLEYAIEQLVDGEPFPLRQFGFLTEDLRCTV